MDWMIYISGERGPILTPFEYASRITELFILSLRKPQVLHSCTCFVSLGSQANGNDMIQ